VTSPDGHRWEVRRRWADRRLPELRRRFREARREKLDGDALWSLWALDFSSGIVLTIGSLVVLAMLILVLVPLVGVALELGVALLLAAAGVLARLLLGRPWTVEAVDLDDPGRRARYAVRGWRGSTREMETLRRRIAATGEPG
jgi:hypothetical protein